MSIRAPLRSPDRPRVSERSALEHSGTEWLQGETGLRGCWNYLLTWRE
jgi:hypothetical protein